MQLQKQEHYINLQMDPLGDPLTTLPIQTGWEICTEQYPNWQFGCIVNPDDQFGNGPVLTRTQTRRDSPEPLLTLDLVEVQRHRWTTTTPLALTTYTTTNASSTENATSATQWQWGITKFPNHSCATWIGVYIHSSSRCSIVQSWYRFQGLQVWLRFDSWLAHCWKNIRWLLHYLLRGDAADICSADHSSPLSELASEDEHW